MKLPGSMSFASVAVAALLAHMTGTTPVDSPERQQSISQTHSLSMQVAANGDDSLAFATIFPAYVPSPLPLPDMVDIAAESALQRQIQPATESATAEVAATASPSMEHQNLFSFKALLQPDGYVRPQWQDMSADARLTRNDTTIDPFIVMIDPGHGGTDPGSKGYNGLLEKDLTLDIARRVRLFLTEFDHIDVRLTRNHDHGLSRQSRVNAIRRTEADMVISLHFNHLPQRDINLVESYYAGPANIEKSLLAQRERQHEQSQGKLQRTRVAHADGVDLSFTDGSRRLARTLQQHVYSEVSFGDENAQNAGVKQETMFVLTRSFTPGVLMEISCLSHAAEADRLESDEYRNRLAAALVDGIRSYHDSLQRAPLKKRGDIGA